MTSWTAPRTWTNTTLAAADLNTDVRDNLKNLDERLTLHGITSESALNKFKQSRVGVKLGDSGSQTISDSTDTTLSWDSETYDTDGFHSTGSNTGRITIPSGFDGTYLISASVRFDANATGDRRIWVEDDGGLILARQIGRAPAAGFAHMTLCFPWDLSAADWIVVKVYQTSTGNLSVDKSIVSTFFQAHRLFAA